MENLMDMKLEYIQDVLDEDGEINLVTNYKTAKEIVSEFGVYEYEDYVGVDLQSDVELYLVTIIEDESFIVETLKRDNKYYLIDCNKLIIDDEIAEKLDDDFNKYLNVEQVVGVGFNMDINDTVKDDDIEECNCEGCDGCNVDETRIGTDEDNPYNHLTDIMEEYALLIENTEGCPHCIRDRLMEFAVDILENFSLVED